MARNNTLSELIESVLDETRHSTDATRGVDHRNYVKRLIRNFYEQLASEHDWSFLRIHKEDAGKDIQAGSRYYDWPVNLDMERAISLWTKFGEVWSQLTYGIGPQEYSAYDSDEDERTGPALRWQVYNETQFEIWPLPASNITGGLRFEGYRKITPLIADDDRCDLDGILIVKFVAARILARKKSADAAAVQAEAVERLNTLKARAPRPRVIMGGAPTGGNQYRIIGGRFARVE